MALITSKENKADELTRNPRKWLQNNVCATTEPHVDKDNVVEMLRELHDTHNLGVDRTFYLSTERFGFRITRKQVEDIRKECQECRRVDPALIK